jgi:hypothetical protein
MRAWDCVDAPVASVSAPPAVSARASRALCTLQNITKAIVVSTATCCLRMHQKVSVDKNIDGIEQQQILLFICIYKWLDQPSRENVC